MVAPKENLLSLDHQINMEWRTFKTQRVSTQKQKTLHLLQYCQEMQDGVMRAQHHNSQLLQQFEEAQGTLRKMATLTAAMKATRMEYEKHLMGIPQWRPQLQEKPWEQRNLNNPGDGTYSSPDQPLPSQLGYDGFFYPPHIQPSWTMHPRNPHELQDSSHAPHFSSHPLQLQSRASGLNHHQVLPCHNVPDQPWFWTAAVAEIPSGFEAQFCKTEPPAESRLHSQASSASSSYRKRGGSRNSRSAQELDTQPVRLSCSAESSDDATETSQLDGKKRGKPKHTSDREHRSPDFQDVTVVRTGVKAAQSSRSIASPEESRCSSKGEGPTDGPLMVENGVKGREDKKNEDSRSSSEESRCELTGKEESETPMENSGSVNIKMKMGRSGMKNEEVKDDKTLQEEDPEESDENDVTDEEEQKRKEKEVSKRSKTTDDKEEDAGAEEEMEEQESEESGGMKDEDSRRLDLASQDEVEEDNEVSEDDESDKDKKTQDSSYDEGEMEEVAKEKKGDVPAQGEDESDSDECIISLHKYKMLHIIPEEAPEDEDEEDKPGNSEEGSDEFSEDDIGDLLAPQQAPKTQEKEMNPEQKAKGSYDRMQIFQVETEEGSSHQPSDSDEFDHFFD